MSLSVTHHRLANEKVGKIVIDITGVDLDQFEWTYSRDKLFSKRKVYQLYYGVQMIMGGEIGLIQFKVVMKGKIVGKAELRLTDNK